MWANAWPFAIVWNAKISNGIWKTFIRKVPCPWTFIMSALYVLTCWSRIISIFRLHGGDSYRSVRLTSWKILNMVVSIHLVWPVTMDWITMLESILVINKEEIRCVSEKVFFAFFRFGEQRILLVWLFTIPMRVPKRIEQRRWTLNAVSIFRPRQSLRWTRLEERAWERSVFCMTKFHRSHFTSLFLCLDSRLLVQGRNKVRWSVFGRPSGSTREITTMLTRQCSTNLDLPQRCTWPRVTEMLERGFHFRLIWWNTCTRRNV